MLSAIFTSLCRVLVVAVHRMCKAASRGVTTVCYWSLWLREVLSHHRRGSKAVNWRCDHHRPYSIILLPSFSSLGSDINSIHKEDNALVDLLGVTEIPVELGLVFLLPEIQWLYQAHQVAWREVLSHSSTHRVGFPLGMNGREWGNRYRTPMLYPRHRTRQRKVYVADERKQRYEDDYDPDLDCYYYLYLCACSYLWNLHSYPY